MGACFCLVKARISCVLMGEIAPLKGITRLTEAGGMMDSCSAGGASPARGVLGGMGVVESRYQHQQTRAAEAG